MPSQYTKLFCCEILTPSGRILGVDAVSATLPMADGMLGVLAERAPLIGELGSGLLTIEQPGGIVNRFAVKGGFAYVLNNGVSILAEEAAPVDTAATSAKAS